MTLRLPPSFTGRLVATAVAVVSAAFPAFAQSGALGPRVPTWQPNGRIEALAIDGTTLYAGGVFDYVGPETGGFGIVDATDATAVNTAANLTAGAEAVVADGHGGWFVATISTTVFGFPRLIAHVLPTGQRDANWVSPSVTGQIDVLALHGGRLFMGGYLTAVDGVPRAGLAALDATTGALLAWDAGLAGQGVPAVASVTHLAFAQGRVYIGGSFTTVAGQARASVAVVDEATAALLPLVLPVATFPGFGELGLSANRVYVSGFFGEGQIRVRAFDLDLVPIAGWDTTAEGAALLATPTAVYVSRYVSSSIGIGVVALDPLTGHPLTFAPVALGVDNPNALASVHALAVGDGRLYIGGQFALVNGQRRRDLVAVDAITGADVGWGARVSDTVTALAVNDGRVAIGGWFRSIGGIAQQNFVTLDLTTGRPTSPRPPDIPFEVKAVVRLGDIVVVGGYTSAPSGQRLAAYARSSGTLLPWSLPVEGTVSALATNGRELIVGGSFGAIGGTPRTSLASVDLQTAALTSWSPGIDGPVYGIRMAGSAAYVIGSFGRVDGEPHLGIAAFDTLSRTLLPFQPAPQYVGDLAVYQDRVLLSGVSYPPEASPAALRWVDRHSGADVSPMTDERGFGRAVAAAGGTIYAVVTRSAWPTELVAVDAASGRSVTLGAGPPNQGAPLAASDDFLAYYDSAVGLGEFAVYRTPRAGAPRALTAAVTGSTIALAWQVGAPPATTAYIVEAGTTLGGTDVGAFPVGTATRVSGVLPPGTYFTRVRSVGANGPGAASSEAIVTVPAPSTPPGAPGTLTASTANGVVSLSWGAATGNATTYVVEAGTATGLTNIGSFATGHLDTAFVTAAPPGTYFVRVRAANAFGVSGPSNELTVVVP